MKLAITLTIFLLFISFSLQRQTVIQISDCANFLNQLSYPEKDVYYELTNDIYCSGIVTAPLPNFRGTLDGRNFAIIGLTINMVSCSTPIGLFSTFGRGAVVKNLFFLDSTVQGSSGAPYCAGTLVGEARCHSKHNKQGYGCTVFNVHVGSSSRVTSNTVQTYGLAAGGIVGQAEGIYVLNCTVRDTVVVNLDDGAASGTLKRHARKEIGRRFAEKKSERFRQKVHQPARGNSRNPANQNPFVGDPNMDMNGSKGSWCSTAGGVVGVVINSFVSGCHNFGFKDDPLALIVSTSNYGGPNEIGEDFAGGVVGVAYNSNVTRSGTARGSIASTKYSGGVIGELPFPFFFPSVSPLIWNL